MRLSQDSGCTFFGAPAGADFLQVLGTRNSAVDNRKVTARCTGYVHYRTSVQRMHWRPKIMVVTLNYSSQGPINASYRKVNLRTRNRLRHWLLAKHDQRGLGYTRYSDDYLHDELGLIRLHVRPELFRVRTHGSLSESRMQENRTSGLMR